MATKISLIFFLLTLSAAGGALGQKFERVVAASPSFSLGQFPVTLALEKGFYREEKLDAVPVLVDGTISTRAALAGDLDYTLAIASGVSAILNGAPLKVVMSITIKASSFLMARPEIGSPRNLKGKIIGVSGFGGITHQMLLAALGHFGLDPKLDVSVIHVGNSSLRLSALANGKIDAALLDITYVLKAESFGLKRLISMEDVGDFPSTGVVVTTRKLKEQPDQVRRFLKATLKGIVYFRTNRDETVSFMRNRLKLGAQEAEALYPVGAKIFSPDGRVSDDGIRILMRQADAKAVGRIGPADIVDWSFLPKTTETR